MDYPIYNTESTYGPAGTVILYQPNPSKQLLLYDMATSSSVLTFLKMHQYTVNIKSQINTEFMSENGRLPVVIAEGNDRPMCGFKEVFRYVTRASSYVPSLLELAYIDWIETKFLEAEMYVCWCYEPLLNDYTKSRYTFGLPWPISSLLYRRKRQEMQACLEKRFNEFTDFMDKFNKFLDHLSRLIGNRQFCANELSRSAVNALVYGHANAILSTSLHPKLVESIKWHKRIETFVRRIEEHYPS